jgi:hypothetical protein
MRGHVPGAASKSASTHALFPHLTDTSLAADDLLLAFPTLIWNLMSPDKDRGSSPPSHFIYDTITGNFDGLLRFPPPLALSTLKW